MALAANSKDFKETNGIVEYKGLIYVPRDHILRERILYAHHDTPLAGHPGHHKTAELIQCNYWWPGLPGHVTKYVRACEICQRTKPRVGPWAAPLHPHHPPPEPWHTVSCDIIGPLPESHRFDAILVLVESLTKLVIAIPTSSTLSAEGAARLYRDRVFPCYGLFKKFISDRGPQFVSQFTTRLHKALGIEANPSTASHPQTDGQTERQNAEIEKYLRAWINEHQDDWSEWLPMAEFAINNRVASATGVSPFFLNHGRHPHMHTSPTSQKTRQSSIRTIRYRSQNWPLLLSTSPPTIVDATPGLQ